MDDKQRFTWQCPAPQQQSKISMAHGGGGKLMHDLIHNAFIPAWDNPILQQNSDSAALGVGKTKLAFTTDSYVVQPLFFPGGDIGSLAVNGTVNDLAVRGARPLYLSVAMILEEGLEVETLFQIVESMRKAANDANVQIVTGDTKVVDKGSGDGIFVNTSGIGIIENDLDVAPKSICDKDVIIVSGDVGRHGIAIMAVREGLRFESTIVSDCAAFANVTQQLLEASIEIHCMRDLTRGGLATALIEIAQAANKGIHITETSVPVDEGVRGACEILGLDPLYTANEGRFVCIVPQKDAQHTLQILQQYNERACVIGEVEEDGCGLQISSCLGVKRIARMLSGTQLPRIC
ncbi:hydrogenase expression/formation protein HypE [Candidatus Uabimicrobium amorphum]|uniref:Hydrogenase expression/formation protein HypE n=1 Tax=Uabimicrobium amorphum TaxID=2596890 RepID=A0A5S9IVB6_UABAM|nr:hydrogenase expression/formation protein HypE [Candidatus Uabimicrobium amorphum]BBM88256.1 hydrogenase expression/formation protein HypE [Candidatus Uabimicrobium amorphum]